MMDTKTTPPADRAASLRKVDNLLAQTKITLEDIEDLTRAEREYMANRATKILAKLKGTARDNFLETIDLIIPACTKNDVWEQNHARISSTISSFMRRNGVMPTKNAIAEQTGLSRQTVAKHLAAYKEHPEYEDESEQFKFMTHTLLASVYRFATNGDMRAARLYLEMVGALNKQPAGTVVNEHKNYIQINNTILRQENLKQLSAEQLKQIEEIVTHKEYRMLS
jgi:predicted transcriptional regulator